MKLYCGAEIEGKTLEIFIESLNGQGEKQKASTFHVVDQKECDILIPIYNEIKRLGNTGHDYKIKNSVRVVLPASNMNNGALLIDTFELYIHDCKNDITGPLGRYVANYDAGGFVCEDLNQLKRVSRIFFSF